MMVPGVEWLSLLESPLMRVAEFYEYMRRREAIRQARLAGQPKPWTTDPILQRYKFTNVKREHDRTTAALIAEFYTPNAKASGAQILLNCAIARYFGTIEFMRAVGWQQRFKPDYLTRVARERQQHGERVFTGAYLINSVLRPGPKEEAIVRDYLAGLWEHSEHIVFQIQNRISMQCATEALMECLGFGQFMAKEILLDTLHTDLWPAPPEDANTYTGIGPGGKRGACRVATGKLGRVPTKEALAIFIELFSHAKKQWPKEYPVLCLDDMQWCGCEFDKYERVRLGEGRPRSTYPGI